MIDSLDIDIASGSSAPGQARLLVSRFTRGKLPLAMREDAELLVSELASNAVTHAPAEALINLQLALQDDCLRVDVTDSGHGFNPPRHPTPRRDGGFGLYLVDCAADRWGVTRRSARCRVWFEMDAAQPRQMSTENS